MNLDPIPDGIAEPHQFLDVAEVYDSLMSGVPYPYWVTYVEEIWERLHFEPVTVLDLACGTGNVTVELLQRGYQVSGVDYSDTMLREARRKLPDSVPLYHQDARALELPASYDACISLFDSLNYILEIEGLRASFAGVYRHLQPGGLFVFDLNAIRALEKGMFDQEGYGRDHSLYYIWHSRYDPASRICEIRMRFQLQTPEGTREILETHVQRGYTVEEVHAELRRAGFEVTATYDAFSFHPPGVRTDRLHFVARRP